MFSASWRCIITADGEVQVFVVAFTSDERQDEELDIRSGNASAMLQTLHHSVVLKGKDAPFSRKTKLSLLKSIIIPIPHLRL